MNLFPAAQRLISSWEEATWHVIAFHGSEWWICLRASGVEWFVGVVSCQKKKKKKFKSQWLSHPERCEISSLHLLQLRILAAEFCSYWSRYQVYPKLDPTAMEQVGFNQSISVTESDSEGCTVYVQYMYEWNSSVKSLRLHFVFVSFTLVLFSATLSAWIMSICDCVGRNINKMHC